MGEMFIWLKLGQNPSEIDVRSYARIKNVIWDQLLATKAEIIQSSAVFSCLSKTGGEFLFLFTFEDTKQGIISGISHGMFW